MLTANQSRPRKSASWSHNRTRPISNGIASLGRQLLRFDEVSGAGGWIAKRLIWPKVFAFLERSRVEQRKVDLLNIGLPSTVAILVTFPISLDPYRNSGELPFRLTSYTFKLHGADAAQV